MEKINKIFKTLFLPFQFSKKYSILLLVSGLMYAIFFNLSVYFLSCTVDKLNFANFDFLPAILPLCAYLLCMGILFLISNLQNYFEQNYKSLAYISTQNNLYSKKYRMKYILNENSKILDTFNLLTDLDTNMVDYIKSLVFFVTLFFQLSFLFLLISVYSLKTAVVIFLFTVIVLIFVIKGGNASYIANKKVQPLERQKNSLKNIMTEFSYAEERNLFDYSSYIAPKYASISTQSRKYKNKALATWFIKAQYGGIVFVILTIIVALFLTSSLMNNELSFGLFVALFSNFVQLSDLMSWNLSDNIDSFIKSFAISKDYLYIMNLDDDNTNFSAQTHESIKSIQFENVTFTYPNTCSPALADTSFSFLAGNKYAIVGENGSGKTTILKLLLGLYSDYTGHIYYNQNRNCNLSRDIISNDICVVYQDFAKYFIPIGDFIRLGAAQTIDDSEIMKVFKLLELQFDTDYFPQILSTPLGNILDGGTNLSGGQWQKLSLARAILSGKPFIILDEPTASIDPISELKIMHTFNTLCQDKTIIYITHRLATIKACNTIYVVDNGCVVESGTHEQLIEKNGLYNTMFESQKNWYKNETGV